MGAATGIGWTDHTFNPWWGCERVSPGCQHCYAETLANRFGHGWGKSAPRRFFGPKHWAEPIAWNAAAERAGRPALVFCASMADAFEDRPDLVEPRLQLFDLIDRTPWLRWQLLTKRPANVLSMVPREWFGRFPANVWIGTTAEDQQRADERIAELVRIPAVVRFVSCEPLLAPLDLSAWLPARFDPDVAFRTDGTGWVFDPRPSGVSWVIVGGESGPNFRPMVPGHASYVCAQVRAARVPLFFKQWGGLRPAEAGAEINLGAGPRLYQSFPPEANRYSYHVFTATPRKKAHR